VKVKANRTDRFFDLSGMPPMWTSSSRSRIVPEKAHVVWYHEAPVAVTVYVRGPILKRDGSASTRGEMAIWGRFGHPLVDAPEWVRKIANFRQ
jgi:hypothetical protein